MFNTSTKREVNSSSKHQQHLPLQSTTLLFTTRSLTKPKFAMLAGLADQKTSGLRLSLLPNNVVTDICDHT